MTNIPYFVQDYVKKLQSELQKMEENYMDAVERNLSLEEQLRDADAKLCNQSYLGNHIDITLRQNIIFYFLFIIFLFFKKHYIFEIFYEKKS